MKGERRTLTESEIHAECRALAAHGFQNVLLLTGDAPRVASIEYLAKAVVIAREYFASVSVEVYALDVEGYQNLADLGLEGVTLYMETYHKDTYAKVHLKGRKKDFDYRLAAVERAGLGGVRKLGIGALLGLYDGALTCSGRLCTQNIYRRSVGRARSQSPFHGCYTREPLSGSGSSVRQRIRSIDSLDATVLPEVGFNLSTRERAALRDIDPSRRDPYERRFVHTSRWLRFLWRTNAAAIRDRGSADAGRGGK